ncbi:hypothetical protein HRbin17_01156 [bacterium HR17]|uniref:Uncharacterized protein n=1 Tax=Candidatus Fervidibacter japonicus TaxID=2035412 RepID=A0A2H5XBT1_9BACT|nr:hypothetical protein HRbin17_01156 [bacterium HR17]
MSRWFWAVGIVIVALMLVGLYIRWRQPSPVHQVKKELARLQQAGEPTTLAELLPPIPPQQDGTPLYRHAIAQLETAQKSLPQPVWDDLYAFLELRPSKPVRHAHVYKALQALRPALQTLRHAVTYPHMRMTDWNVENPTAVMFPHLAPFREFARLLVAEGLWRKRQGDMDGAMESCLTGLRLVRRLGDEPSMIGFLVQGAIFAITVSALQRILADEDPSPNAYRMVIAELQAWDIDRNFVRALQAERVFVIATCEWLQERASRRELNALTDPSTTPPLQLNLAVWLQSKPDLIARNELRMLQHYEALIALARKGEPYDWQALKRLEDRWQQEVDRPARGVELGSVALIWNENAVAQMLMPPLSRLFQRATTYHALQRIGMTAMALRLYRHGHGRYPETLQALVPQYLPAVPTDPFDGKPLRYRRSAKGFKVWSVGEDMKDDGGVEGKPRWVRGDIVWRTMK